MKKEEIKRAFDAAVDFVNEKREAHGDLILTVCMFSALKIAGVSSEIVHGALKTSEKTVFHTWLEVDGLIVDAGIPGKPIFLRRKDDLRIAGLLYIEKYEIPKEAWEHNPQLEAIGKNIVKFLDDAGEGAWDLVCDMAGKDLEETKKIKPSLLYERI